MLFSVGYQPDRAWIDEIVSRAANLDEVYFAGAGLPSGRQAVADENRQLDDLGRIADAGIGLNLLFNANCYGAQALARSFFNAIGESIDRFAADGALKSVTTTSPLIARFVKENFPNVATRASVNMEIGTDEGMEYLADVFDGFYLKRELNRNLEAVRHAKSWCDRHGKRLYILANSGCLNFCPSRTFHDNLVAHEAEIAREDNGYTFHGTCWRYLAKPENRRTWSAHTNWIAPEDVAKYEGLVTAMKLATRTNPHPIRILESFVTGSYLGAPQSLLEPDHSALFTADQT